MSSVAPATRSVWFPRPRAVELRSEDLPPITSREVRIRALASGISQGTELLVYRGLVPPDLTLDLPTLRGAFTFPIKYGYASVGRVVEKGEQADLAVGDLVFTHHPHQTEYVVDATLPLRLAPDVVPERAVFLANVETAVNVLLDAAPRIGERVLVFGQGVVGLLITQLLRRAGAASVVAVEPLPRRRELALRCGAHLAVSPEDAPRAAHETSGGRGADLVIEASGRPEALAAAIDVAGFQASIVVCSWYGSKPATLPLGGAFHRRRLRIVSSQVSAVDPALAPRWDRGRRLALARTLLGDLLLEPLISHRFPIERAGEAYALLDDRAAEAVQVILVYR